jgi:Lon protease-like protein
VAADARRLPMFPLGTVLFPYALLPLHVFEPRYRLMMREVLRELGEFGVVLIERGSEVGGGDHRFRVGTLARVVQWAELPDGRYVLRAVGIRRLRVEEWLPDDPYPHARVVELGEAPVDIADDGAARAARDRVDAQLRRVLALWAEVDPRVETAGVELAADPAQAVFEAAGVAPIGPLDAQRLLETEGVVARLELLERLLADEIELLELRRDR